jgi:hypothetical protein
MSVSYINTEVSYFIAALQWEILITIIEKLKIFSLNF